MASEPIAPCTCAAAHPAGTPCPPVRAKTTGSAAVDARSSDQILAELRRASARAHETYEAHLAVAEAEDAARRLRERARAEACELKDALMRAVSEGR